MGKWLLLCSLVIGSPIWLQAQSCGILDTLSIPRPINPGAATAAYTLTVADYQNDDLADPMQGVCGIELHFLHQYVDKLSIELTAPSGQTVELVGPISTIENGNSTQSTRWFIEFLPASELVEPDSGLLDRWNNNQDFNWRAGGTYTGSYYPATGDLEDFNNGAVNGDWTIQVTGTRPFQAGAITYFRIQFCDETGVDCCFAFAGDLNAPDLEACQGADTLELQTEPFFALPRADSLEYGYTYLIARDGIYTATDSVLDLRGYSAGTYTLCGLSYLREEFTNLPAPDGVLTIADLRADLESDTPSLCGEITPNCQLVTIYPVPDTTVIDSVICPGESVTVGTMSFNTTGTYLVDLLTATSCDSIVQLDLLVLAENRVGLDTTICAGEQVQVGTQTYSTTGVFVDTLSSANGCDSIVTLDLTVLDPIQTDLEAVICPGESVSINGIDYTSTGVFVDTLVSAVGCDSVVRLDLTVLAPQVDVQGLGPITCFSPSVTLDASASSSVGAIEYRWFDPFDNLIGTSAQQMVGQAGTYRLEVTDRLNGVACTDESTITILDERVNIEADAGPNQVFGCADTTLVLGGSNTSAGADFVYNWTTTDGRLVGATDSLTAVIDLPGTYQLLVENQVTGCRDSAQVTVSDVRQLPVVDIGPPATLTCAQPEATLGGRATAQGPSIAYEWSLDNQVLPDQTRSLTVARGGRYQLTVRNVATACVDSASVEIAVDTLRPALFLPEPGLINCANASRPIEVQVSEGGATPFIQWSTTDGQIAGNPSSQSITAEQPGRYQVLVRRSENGCQSIGRVEVRDTFTAPMAQIVPPVNLDCIRTSVLLDGSNSVAGPDVRFEWITTDGNLSGPTDEATATATRIGTYQLLLRDTITECTSQASVAVASDAQLPAAAIEGAVVISCAQPTTTLSIGTSSQGTNFTYQWIGPCIQPSPDGLEALVSCAGTYFLEVLNTGSGCTAMDSVAVVADSAGINLAIAPFEVLNCNRAEVLLEGTATSSGGSLTYQWSGPDGLLGSAPNQTADQAGTYQLQVSRSDNGCSDSLAVSVAADTVAPIADAGPDRTLDCRQPSVLLGGPSTSAGNFFQYTWRKVGSSEILGEELQLSVAEQGIFELTVEDRRNGCSTTSGAVVRAEQNAPLVRISGEPGIGCASPITELNGSTTQLPDNFAITWTGPCLVGPADELVTQAECTGMYGLAVENLDNGCIGRDSVEVETIPNEIVAQLPDTVALPCASGSVVLSTEGSSGGLVEWLYEGGPINLPATNPEVMGIGNYTMIITNLGATCSDTAYTEVVPDCQVLATLLPPDPLTCDQTEVVLDGRFSFSGGPLEVEWLSSQPNCLFDDDPDDLRARVLCPGTYGLVIRNTALDISDTTFVEIEEDIIPPLADAGLDRRLTCNEPQAILSAADPGAGNFEYLWINISGDTISQVPSVVIQTGDVYFLEVRNSSNGCRATDEVVVRQDNSPPTVGFSTPILPCEQPNVIIESFVNPSATEYTYQWSGPGIIGTSVASIITVERTGRYYLTVTDTERGCVVVDSVDVIEQQCDPCLEIDRPDTLTCQVTSVSLAGSFCDDCDGCTLQWFFEGTPIPGATQLTYLADQPGQYLLQATDTQGFTTTRGAQVVATTEPPRVPIGPDRFLTCDSTAVTLGLFDAPPELLALEYQWRDNTGNELGTNRLLQVQAEGTYRLTVRDPKTGCTADSTLVVAYDTITPIAEAGPAATIDCDNNFASFNGAGSSTGQSIRYSWSGPVAFCIEGGNTLNPVVGCAGRYTLTVKESRNGCTATDTVRLIARDALPPIVPLPDTSITCRAAAVDLQAALPVQGDYRAEWCAANGNTILPGTCVEGNTLTVDTPGRYRFQLIDNQTQCPNSFFVNVTDGRVDPTAEAGVGDTLFCGVDSLLLSGFGRNAAGDSIGLTYLWTNASGLPVGEADTPQPYVFAPGRYHLEVTDTRNGCSATDSVEVFRDREAPQVVINQAAPLNCGNDRTRLSAQVQTVSGQARFRWNTQSGMLLNGGETASPLVESGGIYLLTTTDPVNQCAVLNAIRVEEDKRRPDIQINDLDELRFTCLADSVVLDASGSVAATGLPLSYTWQALAGGGQLESNGTPINIARSTGTYRLIVQDLGNFCRDTLTFNLGAERSLPPVQANQPNTLTCDRQTVLLSAAVPGASGQVQFQWRGPDNQVIATTPDVSVSEPGRYQLDVTDSTTGCSNSLERMVVANRVLPEVVIDPPSPLGCDGNPRLLDGSRSTRNGDMTYTWTSRDGRLEGPADSILALASEPGWYVLEVLDTRTGCSQTDSVFLTADANPITRVDFEVLPTSCGDSPRGGLLLFGIEGGNPPYRYRIDNGPQSDRLLYEDLPVGTYNLQVVDQDGCEAMTAFEIPPPDSIEVELGPDVEIRLGDSVEWLPQIQGGIIDTFFWETSGPLSDAAALNQVIRPETNYAYQLTVVSTNGCRATDIVRVFVVKESRLFVPNIFSPGSDGRNDRFFPFAGPEVVEVIFLRIFDRWGNLVFQNENFLPNDPTSGWDGTLNGTSLNPAVFVYQLEVVLEDGSREVVYGDVVLKR